MDWTIYTIMSALNESRFWLGPWLLVCFGVVLFKLSIEMFQE
jgi:hypothetical protein